MPGSRSTSTYFVCTISSSPISPCVRPMPLCLNPPCGASAMPKQEIMSLSITVPALIFAAMASPRRRLRVQTLAARPNSLSLANRTASSSVSKGATGNTGPKVSSLHHPHVVGDVGQQRGGVEVGAEFGKPPAARQQPRAALHRVIHLPFDDLRPGARGSSVRSRPPSRCHCPAASSRSSLALFPGTARRGCDARNSARPTNTSARQFMNAPQIAPLEAMSRLASSSTIIGSLPPSSSTTGNSLRAAASPTRFPVATLPVKISLSMGDSISAAPTGPSPMTTCISAGSRSSSSEKSLQFQGNQRREFRWLQYHGIAGHQRGQSLDRGNRERDSSTAR